MISKTHSTKTNLFWSSLIGVFLLVYFITIHQFHYVLIETPIAVGATGVGQGGIVIGGHSDSGSWNLSVENAEIDAKTIFYWFWNDGSEPIVVIPIWPLLPILITLWLLALRRNRRLLEARETPS